MKVSFPVLARDLTTADVEGLGWAWTPSHLRGVARELVRVEAGEVVYLAVCGPTDVPLAIGGADLGRRAGAGTLYQLAVLPALQSCGLGTVLVGALEDRVRRAGLGRVDLGVEDDSPRARALYERLGYRAFGTEVDRWDDELADGTTGTHGAQCTLLGKDL